MLLLIEFKVQVQISTYEVNKTGITVLSALFPSQRDIKCNKASNSACYGASHRNKNRILKVD